MKVVVVNPIQSQVYFHLTFQSVEMENEANGGEGGAGDGEIPEIELIIRASTIDGRRKGACLFCQVGFLFFCHLQCDKVARINPGTPGLHEQSTW